MNYLKKISFLSLSFLLCFNSFAQVKKEELSGQKSIKLKLIRDTFTKEATLGRLYSNGKFLAYTLERPWKENKNNISCIPFGNYECRVRLAHESGKLKYRHIIVENVPNRDFILFHRGNKVEDSQGCILTGLTRDKECVWNSTEAHKQLMDTLGSDSVNLSLSVEKATYKV